MGEALDGLPPALGKLMRNVAVTVNDDGGDGTLLGLYEGVPLTERTQQYSWRHARPDHHIPQGDLRDLHTPRNRSSRRCGAPSCTRSGTTSASATTGCTSSAGSAGGLDRCNLGSPSRFTDPVARRGEGTAPRPVVHPPGGRFPPFRDQRRPRETWTVGYLIDTIPTRDPWTHRMDISRGRSAAYRC